MSLSKRDLRAALEQACDMNLRPVGLSVGAVQLAGASWKLLPRNVSLWSRKMLYELVAANGDIVMQRKLLRGIKQRAERLAAHHRTPGQETVRS